MLHLQSASLLRKRLVPKFTKGQSGNPAGRPVGSKNKGAQFRELLQDDLPAIALVLRDKALGGDIHAMRLLLERLVPKVQGVDMSLQSEYEPIVIIERSIVRPCLVGSSDEISQHH